MTQIDTTRATPSTRRAPRPHSGWDAPTRVRITHAERVIDASTGLTKGDLVFFGKGSTVDHVGIYVGNGMMIGAQNPSVGTFMHPVTRNPLYGYYTYVG